VHTEHAWVGCAAAATAADDDDDDAAAAAADDDDDDEIGRDHNRDGDGARDRDNGHGDGGQRSSPTGGGDRDGADGPRRAASLAERANLAGRGFRGDSLDGHRLWPLGVERPATRPTSVADGQCDDIAYRCVANDHLLPLAHFPLGSLLASSDRRSRFSRSWRRSAIFAAHGILHLAASATLTGDLAHTVGGMAAFVVRDRKLVTERAYVAAHRALITVRCVARYAQWQRVAATAQVLGAASATAAATAVFTADLATANSTAAVASEAALWDAASETALREAASSLSGSILATPIGAPREMPWAMVSFATPLGNADWWAAGYGAHATCVLECAVTEYIVWQLSKANRRARVIDEAYLHLSLVFLMRGLLTHIVTAREMLLFAYSTVTLSVCVLIVALVASSAFQRLGAHMHRPVVTRIGVALLTHSTHVFELCALYLVATHMRNRVLLLPLFVWFIVVYWHANGVAPAFTGAVQGLVSDAVDAVGDRCARLGARTMRFPLTPLARRGAERLDALRRRVLREESVPTSESASEAALREKQPSGRSSPTSEAALRERVVHIVRIDVAPELASAGEFADRAASAASRRAASLAVVDVDLSGEFADRVAASCRDASLAAAASRGTALLASTRAIASPHATTTAAEAMLRNIRAHVRTVPLVAAYSRRASA
jgi:hypothetical protein